MFSLKTLLKTALSTRLKRKDATRVATTIEQAWNDAARAGAFVGDIKEATYGINALLRLASHGFWIVRGPAPGRNGLIVRTSKTFAPEDPVIKPQLDALGKWDVIDQF